MALAVAVTLALALALALTLALTLALDLGLILQAGSREPRPKGIQPVDSDHVKSVRALYS